MPRSKTQISKLPRDLREPMEFGRPALGWSDAKVADWFEERHRFVFSERLRKLNLLLRELKAPAADPNMQFLWLCLELAKKLYPGFVPSLMALSARGARGAPMAARWMPRAFK